MQKLISINVYPSEAEDNLAIRMRAAGLLSVDVDDITGYQIIKSSIDARGKQVWITLSLLVFIQEPFYKRTIQTIHFNEVKNTSKKFW